MKGLSDTIGLYLGHIGVRYRPGFLINPVSNDTFWVHIQTPSNCQAHRLPQIAKRNFWLNAYNHTNTEVGLPYFHGYCLFYV
jgi:hypothetical protein